MLLFMVALVALLAGVSADCQACFSGTCYRRRPILSGFSVTDRLALDYRRDILYLQLNGNMNTAVIIRDTEEQMRIINVMDTKGIAVDQESELLYLGIKEGSNKLYECDLDKNTTEAVPINIDVDIQPSVLSYSSNRMLIIESHVNNTSSIYFRNKYKSGWQSTSVDYPIDSLVNTEQNRVLFVSNNTLYSYDYDFANFENKPQPAKAIAQKNGMVLSTDKDGAVYVGDATEKVIYRLDKNTDNLEIYGAYDAEAIVDFVVSINGFVIFRDAMGDVAEWIPIYGSSCAVEPPHTKYFIRQINNGPDSGYGPGTEWNSPGVRGNPARTSVYNELL